MPRVPSRADDQRLLLWIAMHESGISWHAIARGFETHAATVRRAVVAALGKLDG